MSTVHLDQVSQAIIASRLLYALPAWSGFFTVDLINRIQSTLKRLYRYGYTTRALSFNDLVNSCSCDLCRSMLKSNHCLHELRLWQPACANKDMTMFYQHVSPIYINSLLSLYIGHSLYGIVVMSLRHPATFYVRFATYVIEILCYLLCYLNDLPGETIRKCVLRFGKRLATCVKACRAFWTLD